MLDINSFLNGFFNIILRMSIYDLIDISIVAYIFYKIFMFIKDTRAEQVFKGIIFLLLATQLSNTFKLHTVYWISLKALDQAMMDEELINKAKKLGISGFIQKPVDTEELTLLINRVMADEDLFCELESLYIGAYTEATLNIFNRLTKTVPEITNISFENKEKTSAGISIVLGIIGKYSGRLIMDMSLETAEKFSECLLRRKAKNNEEVLNVVSEVANMLAGNGCSIINKKNKVFGLRVAPPTTIHGESINISKAELECNFSADIKSEFGDISLNLGFRRGESEWMSDI